ncbi:hypothetical protein Lepto7376_0630 [[Leptolyngbya] sp. PCC 7376]|uniref:phage late control D family protein n=1 Tax=[Leptolyngbya] sp. PCC 7376 TaxID=111781 RepID=UPI00029F306A|nr:contractile injection system protein, VgrG/Pvc8 family [[Leptolyngbya] sp. PCC 7376]AFY37041.1 hypothetical protein Lepto7376_0630 [[Leptolyngbya] sp. PCC 7376]
MPSKPTAIESLSPRFKLLLNDQALSSDEQKSLESDVLSINVSEDIDAISMFDVTLESWNESKQELTWIESKFFELGNEVEIQMGFETKLKTVFIGQITGLEPEFNSTDNPKLVVRGHDRRHLLLRGKKTKSFAKMSDAAIAKKIAETHGLTPKVVETKPKITLESVLQHNQTDFEFLQDRARRIGYELMVEGKELHFRPHANDEKAVLKLSAKKDLLDFSPRLSTMTQLPQVEVRGWSMMEKKAVMGVANASKEPSKMGGKALGVDQTKKAFGKSVEKGSHTVVTSPVSTKAEADLLAIGQLKDMAIAYITAEGTIQGLGDLRAGKTIEITDAGTKFSGLYYLTSVQHSFSEDNGYATKFTARRNST